jgi:hypothetical protein
MATSNSSLGQAIVSPFVLPVTEKLSNNNLGLWKLQVLPAIRGALMEGFLDGSNAAPSKEIDVKHGDKTVKEVNPEYASWVARDQQVLSYLLSNMTRDVMAQVAMAKIAAELWTAVEEIYSFQSRVRSVNTRIALATTKKGNSTASEYLAKVKSYADEMKDVGRPLGDDEFTSYILTGPDQEEYNPLVSAVLTRIEPISYTELVTQITSFKARLEMQRGGGGSQSSVNSASCARGGFNRGGDRGGCNSGRGCGYGTGGRGRGNDNGGQKQRYNDRRQVCLMEGYSAVNCWHRFDQDYVLDERNINVATNSYGIDMNW